MPVYEFVCQTCRSGKKFAVLVGMVANAPEPRCPLCQGTDLTRAVSRFARTRSEEARIDALTESLAGLDENDPKAMRNTMRELVTEAGEDELSRDEVNELVDEAVD